MTTTPYLLTNSDVIAVDQDLLVAEAVPWHRDARVLVKPLAGGDLAVALFNADDRAATITTNAAAVGLPSVPCHSVRDLWSHTDSTGASGGPSG